MLWLLAGVAFALPPAVLGPSGPQWVGTLTPDDGTALVAVVDPVTGDLVVEVDERDGRLRRWSDGQWSIGGEALNPEEPAQGHRMDGEQLISATAALGANHSFQYDEDGRLSAVVWANGGRMGVRYDDEGRVWTINGPGTRSISLQWANGLSWTDGLGRSHQWRALESGPVRKVTLTDPVGRLVTSHYRQRDDEWVLTGWVDPRGLETRIGTYGGRMDVTSPGGRVYRMEVEPDGTVRAVTMPAGHRWRWERGEEGHVERMVDPAGRVTRLERDEAGRVVSVSPSGRAKRIRRGESGEVLGIHSATGAVTQIVRGTDGHIRSIVDALGNAVFIERFENGWPSAILNRAGVRWAFGTDVLGLIDRVEDPMGRVTQLHRNGAGWLERIEDSVLGVVTLGRDGQGRLTSVTDVQGRTSRFEWDASGWLKSLERPGGERLILERNPLGELISLRFGEHSWSIERAPDGQPRRMGGFEWDRDINGAVRSMVGPNGEMTFTRDPAGWIRTVTSGTWELEIDRDANGWPVGWSGTDGTIEVQRDGSGRVVTETGPVETRVLRDPRGFPVRIVAGKLGEWRTQRDATGRPLTMRGPEGVGVSVERDLVGRPKWFRFPDGSILRRAVKGLTVDDVLIGPDGTVMGGQQVTRDADGRVTRLKTVSGHEWLYQYDGSGRLLAMTAEPDLMWTFDADRVLDPEGRLQLLDVSGWLMEAQLTAGPKAWGLASDMVSMIRDDAGRLTGVGGDSGVSAVEYDDLGRLTGYRAPDGVGWTVRYDVRGRPVAVSDGQQEKLWVWSPDVDPSDGVKGVLATGVEAARPWVFTEDGMAVRRTGMEVEGLIVDGRGDPSWVLDGSGGAAVLSHTPVGFPMQEGSAVMGRDGALQWFEGGPVQVGAVALDPVSGQRVDGVKAWPWEPEGVRLRVAAHPADPGPWAPETVWGRPLKILEELGVFRPIEDEAWTVLEGTPVAHFSVPASLDVAEPPLGPDREAIPMGGEDPLTAALLRSVLPGGETLGPQGPAAALIGAELDLPWLPPGWVIPGLEFWRDQGAWGEGE